MKKSVSYRLLPVLPAVSGCIVLLLRAALYTMQNESGLLPYRHPLHIAGLLLAFAVAALVSCFVIRLDGSPAYEINFPPSKISAAGSVLAGVFLFFTARAVQGSALIPLDTVRMVLVWGASAGLIAAGYFLWSGKTVPFPLYATVCLYFSLDMVCRYRDWSGNPQTEDYIFAIFGCVFLALFSYYRAAFSAGTGRRRMLLFCGMMALFFCPAMVPGGQDPAFALAGGIWAATNLCVIDPPAREA